MSIQRWDPWRDIISLREAMNSLLEESFARPRAGVAAMVSGMPVDLHETDDAYIVETVLPGATVDDVEISILGDALRIAAEIREDEEQQEARWLIRERRFGSFERTIALPSQVDAEGAEAEFNDGILKVRLPKTGGAQPQQIQVRRTEKIEPGE